MRLNSLGIDDSIGLDGMDSKALSKTMMDLLRHPKQSYPPMPEEASNILWLAACENAYKALRGSCPRAAPGNRCPPGTLFGRLVALWDAGCPVEPSDALLRCAFRRDFECAKELFAAFPDMIPNPKSGAGTPILHRLAYQGPDKLFELFLEQARLRDPSQIDLADSDGYTPIQWAVRNGSVNRAALLLGLLRPDWPAAESRGRAKAFVSEYKALRAQAAGEYLDGLRSFIKSMREKTALESCSGAGSAAPPPQRLGL